MKITQTIQIETTEIESLEYAMNLAHQGYKDQSMMILGFMGLGGRWNFLKLLYYMKEAEIKNDY